MTTSIVFARFIGPVMLVAAMTMLMDRSAIRAIAEDFMDSPALIYLAGVLTLVMGIAIVTFHNIWAMDWRIIVTLFGYIAVLSGVFRMALPTKVKLLGDWMMETNMIVRSAALMNGMLGAYLTYKGFIA